MNDNSKAISPELEAECIELIRLGMPIAAIKKYRHHTNCGLADAKRWLDRAAANVDPIRRTAHCPYCGKRLRTSRALQCFECGMDWHGATNVVPPSGAATNQFGLLPELLYIIELCQRTDGIRYIRIREHPGGNYDPDRVYETTPTSGGRLIEWARDDRREFLSLSDDERFGVGSDGGWMTEGEWLASGDPKAMFRFIQSFSSERKQRLFAVACLNEVSHLLLDKESRLAVGVLERLADGDGKAEQTRARTMHGMRTTRPNILATTQLIWPVLECTAP